MWVVESIYKAGYVHAVRWDVDTTDAKKALKNTQNGSILLFHADAKDVRCLTKLIPNLLDKGFKCVDAEHTAGAGRPGSRRGSDGRGRRVTVCKDRRRKKAFFGLFCKISG